MESGFWSTHGYPVSRLVTTSVKPTAKFQKYVKFLLPFSPVFSASFRLGEGSLKSWTFPSRAASCAQVMWQWPCNFPKTWIRVSHYSSIFHFDVFKLDVSNKPRLRKSWYPEAVAPFAVEEDSANLVLAEGAQILMFFCLWFSGRGNHP